MKLLLFSDLHCDVAAAQRLVDRSQQVDVLIGAGDFASVRRGIDICIRVLRQVTKPTIVVPGNNESLEELSEACTDWPSARVLHGSAVTVAGVQFFGIGGGIPVTPFGSWSYDFTEQQAADLLASCPEESVLVSHSPPKGVLDRSPSGRSLGSTAVEAAIKAKRPKLVVCGHIHESGGQIAALGPSPIVNAGPGGIEWTIPA